MLMEAVAMHEDEGEDSRYPSGFRGYLVQRWPLGKDWRPQQMPAGSGLRRDYYQLHEKRRDGGVPPLLQSVVQDLDKWAEPRAQQLAGTNFPATAEEVGAIVSQLHNSSNRETRQKMAVLHFFQFREVYPDLPDWCDEQALSERNAYRYCNDAVAWVWKYLVARHRGFHVTGLAGPRRPNSDSPSVT
jgi:hypothetical protein